MRLSDDKRLPGLFALSPLPRGASWVTVQIYSADPIQDPASGVLTPGPVAHIGFMPAAQIVGWSAQRGRSDARSQSEAGAHTLTLTSLAITGPPGGAMLTAGMGVQLVVGSPAAFYPPAAQIRFTGQVSDIGDVQIVNGRQTYPVTITGIRASLGKDALGLVPWAAGIPDTWILEDVITAAAAASPAVGLSSAGQNPSAVWAPVDARPPVAAGARFVLWDIDAQPAEQVISDLTDSTGGLLVELRDGRVDWLIPENRRAAPVAVTLTADQVLTDLSTRQALGDVVNAYQVSYGPTGSEAVVTSKDLRSVYRFGTLGESVSTRLAYGDAAQALADDYVGRYSMPTYQAPSLSVDLAALVESGTADNVAAAVALLTADPGQLLSLYGLPGGSPVPGGLFWIEQITETVGQGRWGMTLALTAYELGAPGVEWAELPAALTFADVPAGLSVQQAVGWNPNPYTAGTFRAVAAGLTFTAWPPGQTFAQVVGS